MQVQYSNFPWLTWLSEPDSHCKNFVETPSLLQKVVYVSTALETFITLSTFRDTLLRHIENWNIENLAKIEDIVKIEEIYGGFGVPFGKIKNKKYCTIL